MARRQGKKAPFMVRQGDVVIIGIRRAIRAEHLTPIAAEGGRTVLAHGEVTGHAHALPATCTTLYGMSEDLKRELGLEGDSVGEDRVLLVTENSKLTHEEHGSIDIPVGSFIVRRQREYSPAEIRQVAD